MSDILDKVTEMEIKAADFGFNWENPQQILEQITSECQEVQEALALHKEDLLQKSKDELQSEIGDLMHATMSLCVFCNFSIEETLEKNLLKFQKRFAEVVRLAHEAGHTTLQGQSFEKLMEFWQKAKKS